MKEENASNQTVVILHDIRSAHNVGSIFRSADAAGVQEIVLTGYTPTPIDRFGRKRGDIAKASLGAEESVSWRHGEGPLTILGEYKNQGFETIAVEQHKRSVPYTAFEFPQKRVFVFGNEVDGLPGEVIEVCTSVIEIPMHGMKESLNVSVCAGIIFFHSFL